MKFYNALIAPLIIEPLRYHFTHHTKETGFYWDPDEKKRTIDVGEAYNYHKTPIQEKPRVVVSRGSYAVQKVGLNNNLAEGLSFSESRGLTNKTQMVFYSGSALIQVEARTKGSCELISDMVSHFILWTRPIICDVLGWKEFGMDMVISDVNIETDEDPGVPKFQVNISIPWMREEHWKHTNDAPELKEILTSISPKF